MSKPRPAELLLGRLAVDRGLVTRSQVEDALALQDRRTPRPPLGVLLVDLGLVRPADMESLLAAQAAAFARLDLRGGETGRAWLFGYLAVERGYAALPQVNEALREQGRRAEAGAAPPPLGRILVEQGVMTPAQVAEVLRLQGDEGSAAVPA